MVEEQVLDEFAPFTDCSEDEKRDIARCLQRVFLKKIDPVYEEEQPAEAVFLIRRGRIEMTRTSDDGEKIHRIGVLHKNDCFGFGEMFFDHYYISTTCLSNCELLRMERDDFLRFCRDSAALNNYVIHALATMVRQRTLMIDWDSADNKLVYFLAFLADQFGTPEGKEIVLSRRITQENFAEALDISREHVSRLFQRLKKQNRITIRNGIIIIDNDWLESRVVDRKQARVFKRKFELQDS